MNNKMKLVLVGMVCVIGLVIKIGCATIATTDTTTTTVADATTTTTIAATTTTAAPTTTTTTTSTTTTSVLPVYSVSGVVRFAGAGSFEVADVYVNVPLLPQLSTTTSASGEFTINALAGNQIISFTREGYTFTPSSETVTSDATLEVLGIPTGWRTIYNGNANMLKTIGFDDDESPYHYLIGGVGGTSIQLTYDDGVAAYSGIGGMWFAPSGRTILGFAPTNRITGLVWLYDADGGVYTYEAGVNYSVGPAGPSDWDLNLHLGVDNIINIIKIYLVFFI